MQWGSIIGFWLLGLCNNYGYVIMLSAAHDIIGYRFQTVIVARNTKSERDCNDMSTGTILLADILPCLIIKLTAPFFPLVPNIRMTITVILSAAGLIFVAASSTRWFAILGVILTSISSGLGEATLLAYMAFFKNRNVISSWSSGTGAAGFFGSFSYAGLLKLGLSPQLTLAILLFVPVLMAIVFWLLLEHPKFISSDLINVSQFSLRDIPQKLTSDDCQRKLKILPSLVPFMVPIGLVYFFEYLINQGLYELVYFEDIFLTHEEQYRWFQVDYQIAVFISRSSVNIVQIKKTWVLAVFQFINLVFFTTAAIVWFVPSLWIVLALVFWEGLLGGAIYVNTFYRIASTVAPNKREFSLAITSFADAAGISLAGILSIPIHNSICKLPKYKYN